MAASLGRGDGEHRKAEIDPDDPARRTDGSSERSEEVAGAAADVEGVVAGAKAEQGYRLGPPAAMATQAHNGVGEVVGGSDLGEHLPNGLSLLFALGLPRCLFHRRRHVAPEYDSKGR